MERLQEITENKRLRKSEQVCNAIEASISETKSIVTHTAKSNGYRKRNISVVAAIILG